MELTRRRLIILAGLGSAALLAGAFIFQALGFAPCALCLWQRWPHAAAVGFGLIGAMIPSVWVAIGGALSALTSAGIGVYHTGVERAWWDGPSACSSQSISGLSTDELFDQIMAAPLVRCDEVAWSLMGLSMATWNVIASLVLAGIWIAAARRAD